MSTLRSLSLRDKTTLFSYALLHPGSRPAAFASASQESSTILDMIACTVHVKNGKQRRWP
ncbi:hypothetical protein D3C81_259200 [compost metagenome]